MTKENVLAACRVEGNNVKLPEVTLDRKVYMDVAKSLNLIGGKWKGGKVSAFVFPNDPTEHLAAIQSGEKKNLKKEYQFYATPDALADYIVAMADIEPGMKILEPSAGQGAIVNAINRVFDCRVDCFELMDINRNFLSKDPMVNLIGENFLDSVGEAEYDCIIANPPFSKNQDIEHFNHMLTHLKPGGTLVCIASPHWQHSNNKKETAFREWAELNCEIEDVAPGTFAGSGTNIKTVILKYVK